MKVKSGSIITLFCLFCLLAISLPLSAKKTNDTLLLKLFDNAEKYDKAIRSYKSELYIKGVLHLKQKNRFLRRVPQSRTFPKDVKDYIGESIGSLDYTAPFTFDRHVEAVSGTFPDMKQDTDMLLDFFNLTIYRESLIVDHLFSPFCKKNVNFYKYEQDSIRGKRVYYSYTPRYNNTQLVKGSFILNTELMVIEKVTFSGKYEFMKFDMTVNMGGMGFYVYLPVDYQFNFKFNFIGNKLEGEYRVLQNYKNLELVYDPVVPRKTNKYDLSERYSNTVDVSKARIDSAFVASHRLIPLQKEEQDIYTRWAHRQDSINKLPLQPKKRRTLGDFADDVLFSHSYINLGSQLGKLRVNPLLDIGLFNYSSTRGYSYRQDFKYVYQFPDQREIVIRPRIGYNIKYKQFFWRFIGRYEYWPRKQGAIEIEIGNGNRIRGAINKNVNASFFSDNYIHLKHEIELVNGLDLDFGLLIHNRQPWKLSEEQAAELNLRGHYKSFSPNIHLEYTPGQYYYMLGNKKQDVYSAYPTFAVDWEAGFKNILGSTSRYERVEFDVSYEWKMDSMHKISWRLGGGKFTNKNNLEFVEYHNFKKYYLPETWEDELGGRFTLLDSHWFNESLYYLRGHIIYESPLLLLGQLGTTWIQRERLYGSALHTDIFNRYFEFGYGLSTHIFDLGFYVSFMNGKYNEIGVKYNFTLFH